jgi:predicted transcriptional regulator of viral defense system
MLQDAGQYNYYPTFYNMSTRTNQRDKVALLLRRHGVMRLSELKAAGIHPPTLARLLEKGLLSRPGRGLYELAGTDVDLHHSLAEIAKRIPKGVICLLSALQYHDITLQNAPIIWVAIGEKDRKPKIERPPVRILHYGEKALSLGVQIQRIDHVPVKIFDPAKTVVDCFRYRRAVGLDVAMEALRMGLASRKATPAKIASYAHELRIWSVIRPYLESAAAYES